MKWEELKRTVKSEPGEVVVVRVCGAGEIVGLRHVVLRTGLPRADAIFVGDEEEATLHVGAFAEGMTVGCASYLRVPFSAKRPGIGEEEAREEGRKFDTAELEGKEAYRLRGMATDADFRGTGVGREMLGLAEESIARQTEIRLLWCDARIPAVEFYKRQGWRVISGLFYIATAGPHFRMMKWISG